jgi:hypothetical protein
MIRLLLVSGVLAAVSSTPVLAANRQSSFVVQASVVPRAVLHAVAAPDLLEITAADVARGYVLSSGRFRVESNTKRGWLLRLAPRTGLASAIEIDGLAQPLVVRDDVVEVYRPAAGATQDLELRYRVMLAPGARPGRYAAPLHLSAVPL